MTMIYQDNEDEEDIKSVPAMTFEEQILAAVKKNPEAFKEILYNAPSKKSNNKVLNESLYREIEKIFPEVLPHRIHSIRSSITFLMRKSLSIGTSKEVPDANMNNAMKFYRELIDLIKRYRRK